MMNETPRRPSPESLLAKLKEGERAKLRVYIGAAAGVGKTYQMLEDAHQFKKQGMDIVVAFVEPHGRADTEAMMGDLERVPMREIEYRGVTIKEMDVDAVIARRPEIAIVDELAHTNVPGSKHHKRYEDVLELLDARISVIFGQSARSRWDILLCGSVINRFLNEARDATVQVVPLERHDSGGSKEYESSQ